VTCHLVDDGLEHREAVHEVVLIPLSHFHVDHREGVDAEARGHGEFDESTALQLGRMLERAAIVDHYDLGPGAAQGGTQFLQRHGLARTGLTEHRDIVIARVVLERRPEEGLAATPDQHHVRHVGTEILALDRREAGRRRRQDRAEALHVPEVERKTVGHRHRHRREQALDLQVAIVEQIPSRSAVHRLQDALVGIALALGREGRHRIERLDQLATLPKLILDELPLARLVLQLGQHARRLGIGKAGGAHELAGGPQALAFGVGEIETQVRRDRAGHAQLVREHVADQLCHVPRRPALREVAHRERAHVEHVGIDLADLRCLVDHLACRAEPLGAQQDTVRLDLHLQIVPHRLVGDRIERVVDDVVVTRRRCRRRDVVDPRDQRLRVHRPRMDADRFQ